ncbi:hypothetical protein UR09_04435 [Candidatus Nitromaritima sp. SCGC AAA799-A02]|nr:hypothetical protein UR09_04435 [Candidatus Nitromaritima sp. SCGC AAA799-A02]
MNKLASIISALLVILFLLLISLPAQAADRGIEPVAIKDSSGKQVGLYKGSYALVIGVSRGQVHS